MGQYDHTNSQIIAKLYFQFLSQMKMFFLGKSFSSSNKKKIKKRNFDSTFVAVFFVLTLIVEFSLQMIMLAHRVRQKKKEFD